MIDTAGTSTSARDEILARVRSALAGSAPPPPVERRYRGAGKAATASSPELVDVLVDRLEDYRAHVHRTGAAGLADTIAGVLRARSARKVVVPAGLPRPWVTDAAEALVDTGELTVAELDDTDGVVTGCAVAIADTGTIILDAGPDQGRRAITLVPDLHVCVVRADQVVRGVPEGLARLDPTRPLTFISGPSATSDIELNRVEGVHGPRTLDVVLVDA